MTLSNAVYVDLSFNNLNGTLPEEFGSKSSSLRQLYLDHNQFSGTIPESYSMAGNGSLLSLYLNDNMLIGGLPNSWVDSDELNATSSINTINVQHNNLTEAIDNILCELGISNGGGNLVELQGDCDICQCIELCSDCFAN